MYLKRTKIVLFFLFITLIHSCEQDCNNVQNGFSSYQIAENKIRKSKFNFVDKCITTKSSWIRSVTYYSCDYKNGYLLIETYKKVYIHSKVPMSIWKNFKKAKSYGEYYNQIIKGRYKLVLQKYAI